jgi:hypothetical protein
VGVAVGVWVAVLAVVGVGVIVAVAGADVGEGVTAVDVAMTGSGVGLSVGRAVASTPTATTGSATAGVSVAGGTVVVQPIRKRINKPIQPGVAPKRLLFMRTSLTTVFSMRSVVISSAMDSILAVEKAGVDGSRTHRCSLGATSHRF